MPKLLIQVQNQLRVHDYEMICTHVVNRGAMGAQSPLDQMT